MFLKGNDLVGIGKCSYGGKDDVFFDVNVIGGINKEIFDLSLFFYFFFYYMVGEVVI